MKKILFAILALLPGLSVLAQTPEELHFYVDGGNVCWQQVYESQADSTAILDYLLGSGNFADLTGISGGISFSVLPRKVDYRAAGLKTGSVAMYILNYMMTAHGVLQMREGRYRVTVDHVVFRADPDTPLETYALDRTGKFKPLFTASSANAGQALDYELTQLFTVRAVEEDTW